MTSEALGRELRDRGLRLTPQRQMVLDAVASLGHGTPEEVFVRVRTISSAVNISTVYRALELLEALGLVTHVHLGAGAPTYHWAAAADHLHLVCRGCGAVEELPAEQAGELLGRIRAERGFAVDVAHLALYGLCAACEQSA